MENLIAILNKYGWPALIALLALSNASKMATFAERVLSKIWPTFAEQQRFKSERAAAAKERIDTILALKGMLVEYRESLKASIIERQNLQERLYDLVKGYERLSTQTVEVLRTISESIQLQTHQRLNSQTGVGSEAKKR